MRLPYVGITGFTSQSQINQLMKRIPSQLFANRRLMTGIVATNKTLAGEKNNWPGRCPPVETIPEILTGNEHCLGAVHYFTEFPERLGDEAIQLLALAGNNCHAIQLNAPWPDPKQLGTIRHAWPNKRIILQIRKSALEATEYNNFLMVNQLKPYVEQEVIDDILIDSSGGMGDYTNPQFFYSLIGFLNEEFSGKIGIGYAGGLRAERLFCVMRLAREFPMLNLDAEGQLRSPPDQPKTNELDPYKAYAFAVGALSVFAPNAV